MKELFSIEGRITRRTFFNKIFLIGFLGAFVRIGQFLALGYLDGVLQSIVSILIQILLVSFVIINFCTIVKRSHDFNSNGYMAGGLYAIIMAIFLLSDFFALQIAILSIQNGWDMLPILNIIKAIIFIQFIYLVSRSGDKIENSYGKVV